MKLGDLSKVSGLLDEVGRPGQPGVVVMVGGGGGELSDERRPLPASVWLAT